VHYHVGASVWEFDASEVSCNGNILVLNHSEDIRFINRRRFLRVPVNNKAFIARFPFEGTCMANASGDNFEPPEFVPALVTEMAGPGLRIETQLDVKPGDRILVVFRLDEEKSQDLGLQSSGKTLASKIVEDIGKIRHVKAIQGGFSIAVELTGLGDSDINTLIRATNEASLRAGHEGQSVQGFVNEEETVHEHAPVKGA
jgi:hypothetical protein